MKRFFNAKPGVLIIFCRHGATTANESGAPLVRGWQDFELDDHGKMEAQLLGYKLRPYGPKKIVNSDFIRDAQTAHIIANIVETNDLEADVDLRTWDVGSYSGQPIAIVNPAILELYKNPGMKPPGSDESFNQFSSRFLSAIEKKMLLASIDGFRPILIVTHGKNIALAKTYVDGGNAWDSIMPEPAGIAVMSVGLDRILQMEIIPPYENVIEDL